MCGITGFIANSSNKTLNSELVSRMVDKLEHRGPDGKGVWIDDSGIVALGHRRLAILDLSESGHQPMLSKSGRFALIFNGEIYNHLKIRNDLQSSNSSIIKWDGHSDTETLLAAIEEWGFEKALIKCTGMFAIALWDNSEKILFLARDRFGEKPLYYGWQNETFMFGSELKSFKCHPDFKGEINRESLKLFLRYNYVPSPYSIYEDIHKLPPGNFLRLKIANDKVFSLHNYWSLIDAAQSGEKEPLNVNDKEAISLLEQCLGDSVESQLISDVPLGAFLSGGIDSSLIVSMMKARSLKPVKTFTIGFEELDFNEAKHAKAVAMHLGTEHSELYVSSYDALDIIPHLPLLYDEPFADSSQIPTFLIAKMSSEYVKVALSGDGGDELFGGYNRYLWSRSIVDKTSLIPKFARQSVGSLIKKIPSKNLDYINNSFLRFLPTKYKTTLIGDKIHKVADLLSFGSELELYKGLVSQWQNPDEIVKNQSEANIFLTSEVERKSFSDIEHQMMFLDAKTYLPDDILCKVDRAAMGVSLETRVPFLNHNVVSLAWQLPLNMKIRDRQGKWILRELLCQHVPKSLIERPKQGFSLPIAEWLRGPLREWAEVLLERSRLESEGFFYPDPIRKAWQDHLNGKNMHNQLWGILMFQAWLEME
jgi:asparagine synthase (glutamine-hydrolysing)